MSSLSAALPTGLTDAERTDHWLRVTTAWAWRFVASSAIMAAWLATVLFALAYVLPQDGRLDNGVVSTEKGIYGDFAVQKLLGVITALYYLCMLPLMLLPLKDDERFTWFLYTAFGWMACLLGSVGLLWNLEILEMKSLPLTIGWRLLALVLAAVFVVSMGATFAIRTDGRRRLTCLVILLVGWLIIQGGSLAYLNYLDAEARAADFSNVKTALIMASLLYVALGISTTLPETPQMRRELSGFLILVWCFLLASILCYQMLTGAVRLVADEEVSQARAPGSWLVGLLGSPAQATSSGLVEFGCIVATLFVAPVVGWLGMPWTKGRRLAWGLCLFLAAAFVFWASCAFPFHNNHNLISHLYENYDGQHLLQVEFFLE